MNGFTSLWQRVYFNIFTFNRFTQLYVWGLPFLLLLRNKYVKNAYRKRGVPDPEKSIKHALIDREDSTIVWITDGLMCILVMLVIVVITNALSAIIGVILITRLNKFAFIAVILVSTMSINYLLLWKNSKYKTYFRKFEQESKMKKRKWAWISFGVIVIIVLLVVLSFMLMEMGLHR